MKYWIDDQRSPFDRLPEELAKEVIWIKKIREAIKIVYDNPEDITTLYLDYYMDDQYLFGSEIVFGVLYDGREKYKSLKEIYLHSSDETVIEELIEECYEELKKIGIELKIANY